MEAIATIPTDSPAIDPEEDIAGLVGSSIPEFVDESNPLVPAEPPAPRYHIFVHAIDEFGVEAEFIDIVEGGTVLLRRRDNGNDVRIEMVSLSELSQQYIRNELSRRESGLPAEPEPKIDLRTWRASTGNFSVEAKFVSTDSSEVVLLKPSGELLHVPLDKLSGEDRVYIDSITAVATNPTANVIVGKVIKITDGDTIHVLDSAFETHKIRLEGIDAPESGQNYASKSTQALSDAVFQKQVRVEWFDRDKYERVLGHVYVGDSYVNHAMVESGWAWRYKKYSDDEGLAAAEVTARLNKLGLWADLNEPMPPWVYRSPELLAEWRRAREPKPVVGQPVRPVTLGYWLNTSSNVRHNSRCKYYRNTSRGRACEAGEGKACGICGG